MLNFRKTSEIRILNLNTLSDRELLLQCRQRQSDAFEELVRRYQDRVYRFLYRLLGTKRDAEKATGEVFMWVWNHTSDFTFQDDLMVCLYQIACHIVHNYDKQLLNTAQKQCPRLEMKDWLLLILFYHERCAKEDIEVILECSSKELYSQISRVRNILYEQMGGVN